MNFDLIFIAKIWLNIFWGVLLNFILTGEHTEKQIINNSLIETFNLKNRNFRLLFTLKL